MLLAHITHTESVPMAAVFLLGVVVGLAIASAGSWFYIKRR